MPQPASNHPRRANPMSTEKTFQYVIRLLEEAKEKAPILMRDEYDEWNAIFASETEGYSSWLATKALAILKALPNPEPGEGKEGVGPAALAIRALEAWILHDEALKR